MILGKKPALYIAALAVSAGLAGCGTPESMTEPIVSSFNEASVEIQVGEGDMGFMSEEMRAQAVQKADAKAVEICARGPNRRAEFASQRRVPISQYLAVTRRLYLCLK
ncbi:hypothetical protein [Roseovarius indicus]|uniref:hypothetical protein n=1 Tax=Roseovarius indicus TaxID=540747 RepID=UPI0007D94AD8|nr:hypothetical protein [Roseovarius indicus]OAO06792.1 hypothetical protein A8B76_14290 [Roseovarius indicus]